MKHTRRFGYVVIFLLVFAATSRGDIAQIGPNSYVAGVRSDQFEFFTAPYVSGRQRQENWCWAACVQMVLNYHGLIVSQEQIVQRVFGQQVNQAADRNQILQALSGWAFDLRGRASVIKASPYVWDEAIINDLAYRWPLIVGLKTDSGDGHAYVLTAAQFHYESYFTGYSYVSRPVLDYVVLRDPSPYAQSRQVWSWSNFRSRLLLTDRVSIIRL